MEETTCTQNVPEKQAPARSVLKSISMNKGPKVVVQPVSNESPLSKFLKSPEPRATKNQKFSLDLSKTDGQFEHAILRAIDYP